MNIFDLFPRFEDRTDEQTGAEFLAMCRRNKARVLRRRVARRAMMPWPLCRLYTSAVLRAGRQTYREYRGIWRGQRDFFKRLRETRAVLDAHRSAEVRMKATT